MLEITVEDYFVDRVKSIGGEVRKLKWQNRKNAPDRIVFFKGCHFVELKRPGEKPRPEQLREHERMRRHQVDVWVASTKSEVDNFIHFLSML